MTPSRLRQFCLIAYLAMFLNVGPAAHRAPIFGLHQTGTEAACGCCPRPIRCVDDQGTSLIETSLADCAFCKFFDQYNSSLESRRPIIACKDFTYVYQRPPEQGVSVSIPQTARGPPVEI